MVHSSDLINDMGSTKKINLNCLKIAHLNVRSLFTGFVQFTSLITFNNFDLVAVTETWLSEDIPSAVVGIDGYKLYRADRSRTGGGVGIYVKKCLNSDVVLHDYCGVAGIEFLCIRLQLNKHSLLICVFYTYASSLNDATEFFDNFLSFITPQCDNILITGDLNEDFHFNNKLNDCFVAYGFQQIISESTRVTRNSETLIDPIFINNNTLFRRSGVINADLISDHRLAFCILDINIPKMTPKCTTYRDFKNFLHDKFMLDLNKKSLDNIYYILNIEDKIRYLNTTVLELFDYHAPFKTSFISKPYAPWLTPSIKELMKQRNRALSLYKQTKSAQHWLFYKQLRNSTVAALKREKKRT
ncbi:hypothetical protein Zmor_016125 [Zophobas morio]|uniref:Endonuclease/exonuclease/phosphatase domain-containing protein n=1 Tax=Zophobas morio TaxID=2755281 RepID=A0AA38MHU1_9CUCU|nr:hypothetical protein Zmor_016125 [Zophobas morio]